MGYAPKKTDYYLTLFKIEGHSTWRSLLTGTKADLNGNWHGRTRRR